MNSLNLISRTDPYVAYVALLRSLTDMGVAISSGAAEALQTVSVSLGTKFDLRFLSLKEILAMTKISQRHEPWDALPVANKLGLELVVANDVHDEGRPDSFEFFGLGGSEGRSLLALTELPPGDHGDIKLLFSFSSTGI
ncbi:MAG: hypothetical protein HZB12_01865 [Candidatus Yonathbacteria bacterium]|nr:hypothetical protein [Candidatus Yonathbacteria bacterium]